MDADLEEDFNERKKEKKPRKKEKQKKHKDLSKSESYIDNALEFPIYVLMRGGPTGSKRWISVQVDVNDDVLVVLVPKVDQKRLLTLSSLEIVEGEVIYQEGKSKVKQKYPFQFYESGGKLVLTAACNEERHRKHWLSYIKGTSLTKIQQKIEIEEQNYDDYGDYELRNDTLDEEYKIDESKNEAEQDKMYNDEQAQEENLSKQRSKMFKLNSRGKFVLNKNESESAIKNECQGVHHEVECNENNRSKAINDAKKNPVRHLYDGFHHHYINLIERQRLQNRQFMEQREQDQQLMGNKSTEYNSLLDDCIELYHFLGKVYSDAINIVTIIIDEFPVPNEYKSIKLLGKREKQEDVFSSLKPAENSHQKVVVSTHLDKSEILELEIDNYTSKLNSKNAKPISNILGMEQTDETFDNKKKNEHPIDRLYQEEQVYFHNGLLYRICQNPGGLEDLNPSVNRIKSLTVADNIQRKVLGNEQVAINWVNESISKLDVEEAVETIDTTSQFSEENKSNHRTKINSLYTTLSFIIDYGGFRIQVLSIPPLHEEQTLFKGRKDAWSGTVSESPETHSEINQKLQRLGSELNLLTSLSEDPLQNHKELHEKSIISLGYDVQIHKCNYGRYYLMNLSRLCPPDFPTPNTFELITNQFRPEFLKLLKDNEVIFSRYQNQAIDGDVKKTNEKQVDETSIASSIETKTSENDVKDFNHSKEKINSSKLSADTFRLESRKNDIINSKALEKRATNASSFLREYLIDRAAKKLDLLEGIPYNSRTLSEFVHNEGINIRYLGLLFQKCVTPHSRQLIFVEILARCLKSIVEQEQRRYLRQRRAMGLNTLYTKQIIISNEVADSSEMKDTFMLSMQKEFDYHLIESKEGMIDIVRNTLNLCLGKGDENSKFWKEVLAPLFKSKFQFEDPSDTLKSPNFMPQNLLLASIEYHLGIDIPYSNKHLIDLYCPEPFPAGSFRKLKPRLKWNEDQNLPVVSSSLQRIPYSQEAITKLTTVYPDFVNDLFQNLYNEDSSLSSTASSTHLTLPKSTQSNKDTWTPRALRPKLIQTLFPHISHYVGFESVLESRYNFCRALLKDGHYDDTIQNVKESLQALSTIPTLKQWPIEGLIRSTLMTALYKSGKIRRAVKEFERAFECLETSLGKNHPFLSVLYVELADLYYFDDYHDAARVCLTEAIKLVSHSLGSYHCILAQYLQKLGTIYLILREIPLAHENISRALLIHEQNHNFGEQINWFEVAACHHAKAEILRTMGNYAEAYDSCTACLYVHEQKLTANDGVGPLEIMKLNLLMYELSYSMNAHEAAINHIETALEIRKSLKEDKETLKDIMLLTRRIISTCLISQPLQVRTLLISHAKRCRHYIPKEAKERTFRKLLQVSPSLYFEQLIENIESIGKVLRLQLAGVLQTAEECDDDEELLVLIDNNIDNNDYQLEIKKREQARTIHRQNDTMDDILSDLHSEHGEYPSIAGTISDQENEGIENDVDSHDDQSLNDVQKKRLQMVKHLIKSTGCSRLANELAVLATLATIELEEKKDV